MYWAKEHAFLLFFCVDIFISENAAELIPNEKEKNFHFRIWFERTNDFVTIFFLLLPSICRYLCVLHSHSIISQLISHFWLNCDTSQVEFNLFNYHCAVDIYVRLNRNDTQH